MITQCSIRNGSEFMVSQQVVNTLESFFSGYEWMASVDGGILYIKNETLSPTWGMQLLVDSLTRRDIINTGGEFLERFGMPSRYNAAMVAGAKRDFTGSIVSEKWTKDLRYKKGKGWKA